MLAALLRQEKGRRTSPQNHRVTGVVLSEAMRLSSSGFWGQARTAPGAPARYGVGMLVSAW
jgi:hypothetical protein